VVTNQPMHDSMSFDGNRSRWDLGLALFLVVSGWLAIVGCGGVKDELQAVPQASGQSDRIAENVLEPKAATAADLVKVDPVFYSVSQYDETRDPGLDLRLTVTRAQREKKRILLQVGGDWCGWCGRLAEFMRQQELVRQLLEDHFVVMKVAYPTDHSEDFLASFPAIEAYPHLFVLDSKGDLIHSQDTEELEQGEGYDETAVLGFLNSWRLDIGNGPLGREVDAGRKGVPN
jgi:hypothetical protein